VDGCDPALATGPFWDVTDGQAVAPAVQWMHESGVTTGYANGTYRAAVASMRPALTRGQLVRFLWRMAGSPTGFAPNPWTDGPPGLDPALDWLAGAGVMPGYPGPFHADSPITRGTAVRLLWRFAGAPSSAAAPPWFDVDATRPELAWVAEHGIMTGFADGSFRPTTALTRGQAALALFHLP
jgi:hypothetical protein